jgi:hypothetical protein
MTDDEFDRRIDVDGLTAAADKIDEWADTAELMGDERQATQLRERARGARMRAMLLLDERRTG